MKKAVTPILAIGVALLSQVLFIPALWQHNSANEMLLGQFSLRYAAVLASHVGFSLLWLLIFAYRHRLSTWIRAWNARTRVIVLVASSLPVFALWFLPVEEQAQQYLTLNWLLLCLFILTCAPVDIALSHRWYVLAAVGAGLLLLLCLFTVTSVFPFSPDEAHWADYASTYFMNSGVYARTWMMKPVAITPGLGWSVPAYGWALENIAFDIRIGRIWNFAGYLLAFTGVGLLAYRLYGRQAAWISILFAVLSTAFIPVMLYRPDHQLTFASVFIVLAAVTARQTESRSMSRIAHFACGLLATLSLQLHAAGIAFAAGMSLFYAAEWLFNLRSRRRLDAPLWFGLGALLGSVCFYLFNILPVGGVESYLAVLLAERGWRQNSFVFLTWTSLFEGVVILSAFAFILWRHSAADRLYLSILASLLICLYIFDTQGYRSPVTALYAVAVGTLFAHGFQSCADTASPKTRLSAAALCLLGIMTAPALSFVNWQALGQWLEIGTMPEYAYTRLRPVLEPYITDDDMIASSQLLIWTFPNSARLYSVAGEPTAMREWDLPDPLAVWERVKPTVVIEVHDEMTIETGLQSYMDLHDFQRCTQLSVDTREVSIYRPSCAGAA